MNPEAIYEGVKEIMENNNLKEYLCNNLSFENVGTEEEIKKVYSMIDSV